MGIVKGAGSHRRIRGDRHAGDALVDFACGLDARNHFLADVAALVIGDIRFLQGGLWRQHALDQFMAPRRDATGDAPGFKRLAFQRWYRLWKLNRLAGGNPPVAADAAKAAGFSGDHAQGGLCHRAGEVGQGVSTR